MTDLSQLAKSLTKAQREALERVCATNGGGVRIPVGQNDEGYGIPTTNPWRALWAKDLIQGKASHAYRVVHTRLGWSLRAHLKGQTDAA